ncbi:Uncharacterised protein [Serratia proteamaculans]|nr:Uncharacterised protein [Serratia proteamaculans]CAI0765840.1 Uncharacterised protein [Serratia proteamaculans]CAI0805791.1 Uncharacterised protein [Serratia proteamaculans]CAI0883916.1 Uncharacterised protein [Serratia proteamaculans]CAI2054903.1 Uncharacterised protein [Serratia proteamaculans]
MQMAMWGAYEKRHEWDKMESVRLVFFLSTASIQRVIATRFKVAIYRIGSNDYQ